MQSVTQFILIYIKGAMPTFLFFRKGVKVGEVVGADISRVESLTSSLASASGASSFPVGGRVLGSGAPPRGTSLGGSQETGFLGLTVMQQQYLIFGAAALFLVYYYFNQ